MPPRTKPAKPSKSSLRVLHAEDSEDCAVLVRRALKRAGFECPPIRVVDGAVAIEFLTEVTDESRPDVVLLDVNMPLKSGFDVLEWIRQQPSYRKIPVVMLTSSEEKEDIERAEKLGVTKFLQKEGTYREVVKALEEFLGS